MHKINARDRICTIPYSIVRCTQHTNNMVNIDWGVFYLQNFIMMLLLLTPKMVSTQQLPYKMYRKLAEHMLKEQKFITMSM